MGVTQVWGAVGTSASSTFTCGTTSTDGVAYAFTYNTNGANSDTVVFHGASLYSSSVTYAYYSGETPATSSADFTPVIYNAIKGTTLSSSKGIYSANGSTNPQELRVQSGKILWVKVTNCISVILSGKSGGSRTTNLDVYLANNTETPISNGSKTIANSAASVEVTGMTASNTYLIKISGSASNNCAVYELALVYPHATACGATAPGNISKGTPSSGTLRLTSAGSAASSNTWYWQSAADGTATNLGSGATKDVTAAGTYYIRSYYSTGTCWSDAKSITITADDLLNDPGATFEDGAYAIGGSALDLSDLFSSSSSGAVTYTVEEANGTGASISTASFSATTAGVAKIKAVQAANGYYKGVTKYAYIKVGSTTMGSHTITYTLSPINSSDATLTSSQVTTSYYIEDLTTINHSLVGLASSPSSAKNRTAKVNRISTAKDNDKYVYLTFDVAEGYTFTPSSIVIKVANVSNTTTFDAELVSENSKSVGETGKSFASTDGTVETWTISNSDDTKTMTGTVTLKIWPYAATAGAFRFGNTITITGTVAVATPSCTAPNHVDITPTTEDGNYGWRYTTGETLKLTATPYSSAGTGSPITSGITGYQWQKYVGSEWTNLVDGGSISGATTANLQISGLTTSNGGSYRCTISTGATCSTSSGGYWVRVFTLNGNYSGSSFTENAITWTGANSGTATVHLNAGQTYEFKIYDNDGKTFGNGGTIAADATGWGFGTGSGNCSLTTYYEGDYTFTITDFNHAADGSPYVTVAATYPERTIYMECGDWKNDGDKMAIYYWRGDKNGWSDFMSTFDCDNNVRYVDIPSWAQYIIFGRFASSKTSTGNWDDKHNQSCNLTLGANDKFIFSGWSDCDGNSSFTNTTSFSPSTYTITFAANGGSGSMSSISSIACDANQALTANTFTKTGYNFANWTANVDVKVGGSTISAGSAIANQATIQNIRSNITLTAQWSVNSYDLTWNLGGGTTTSAGTGIASGVSANTTSSVAYGTSLTAPTVTKTYYTFSAWSPTVASTMPAANTTYTATWTANKYNVSTSLTNVSVSSGTTGTNAATYGTDYSVTLAGATGYNLPATVTVTIGGNTATLTTDYTWNSSTGVLTVLGAKVTGNIAITATGVAKTYSINLDDNGGSADGGATATYLSTSLSSIGAPTYSGHTVDGYYTSANCTTKVATGAGALQASITVDEVAWTNSSSQWIKDGTAKFYAHWKCNTPTITDNGDNTVSITVPSGTTVRYTTDGTTPTSSTGTVYSATFDIDEDVTVNAIAYQSGCTDSEVASADCEYTATYTVTYAYNGATGGDGTASATAASVTLPTPTKTDYTFDGWYNTAGTKVGDGGDTYNPTADIMLYARWQSACAGGGDPIEFQLFDGSEDNDFASSPIEVSDISLAYTTYDKPADATDISSKTNNIGNGKSYAKGYQFSTSEISKGANRKCLSFTIPEGYTATFTHAFGASGNNRVIRLGSSLVTSDDDDDYIATLVTVPGSGGSGGIWGGTYSSSLSAGTYFITGTGGGWQVVELIFSLTSTSGGSGTCYHVYYHGNGAESGFISDPGAYANSATPTVLNYNSGSYTLTKDGYEFQGWATAADGDVVKTAGQTVTISSADVHLYAVWAEVVPCTAAPTVTAGSNSSVTSTTATVTCADGISSLGTGGCTITSYGFVIGTSSNPAIGGSGVTQHEVGTSYASVDASFYKNLTGLTANTTYYVRPYATNGYGTAYGTQTSFTTLASYTVTYNGSDNGGGSVPTDSNSPYAAGSTVTVLGNTGSLTKTMNSSAATFLGWNTNSDTYSGDHYNAGQKFTISGNTTLYAVWGYPLSYNTDGGTINDDPYATYYISIYPDEGDITSLPSDVTKTGYDFAGWKTQNGNGSIVTAIDGNYTGAFSGDYALKAMWTAKTYSITLDAGNGTGGSEAVTMTYNSASHTSITAPTAPTGYTFAGWYSGEGGTGAMVMNASGTLQASVAGYTDGSGNWTKDATCTLYAKYTANYPDGYIYITDVMATTEAKAGYTITMTKNSANYNGTLGSTLQTNRAGYEYWADATGSSGNITLSFSDALPASATAGGMIIDVWWGADDNNRTTSIALNGGSAEQLDAANTSTGDRDIVKKATYATELKSLSSITLSCNGGHTVWFRIGIKNRPGYLLTYDDGDGSGAPSAEYKPNATITLSSTEPTRNGYIFDGWQVGGSGTIYQAGDEFSMPASAVTLVAKWTAIDFEFKAGTTKGSEPTDGTVITSSNLSTYWTAGAVLTGGTMTNTSGATLGINASYGFVYAANGNRQLTINLTGSKALGAGTVITVYGYSNNSTDACGFQISGNDMSPATYTPASATQTAFTQTYTVTEGSALDGETSFTVDPANNIRVYLNRIILTGCAEVTGYTIAFEGNGNTGGSMSDVTEIEEGNSVTLAANGFTKNGYTFANWTADVAVTVNSATVAIGDPIADEATIQNITSDITLTAVWTPNTYDITYNMNGASWAGGYSAPANYTVGTGATLPVAGDITNTGYTFGGWYDNSGLTGSAVTTISTSDYGDKEFWAKWTEKTYTITYNANGDGAGNVGDATGSTAATEGHYVTVASCGFELDGYLFTGWNTKSDGTGESYGAGEDIELTADMTLYAQWAEDYIITWGNVQIGGAGATVTPNLGGGNYTITANTGSWTGSLDASMISSETSGVTITNVTVNNGGSPKTITVTFAVGAEVVGESIGLTLSVPAAGVYGAQSDTHPIAIDRCTGSSGGTDGVLFSAEFKDSGLGTGNICDAANTPVTFTTDQLKAAAVGGSIKAYTTSDLTDVKYVDNGVYLKGTNGVIQIDLDNAINTNDLFEYVNVHSSNPSAYLRHTSASNTTDQIVLTGYGSRNVKVMLPAAFNGKTTLYIVKNSTDFKLHKAAVVRPAFLMLVDDEASTGNLEGTDVELTTSSYLSIMKGGHVYYTSPSSGDLKITQNSSKNYITFAKTAGYLKVVLNDALQEGDVIGYDTHSASSEICFTTTTTRSTDEHTSSQLYTVGSSSPLKGQTTFYIWYYSSSTPLRGLQIARSGIAGGGGGSDKITPTLSWSNGQEDGAEVDKNEGDPDFTISASTTSNSLGTTTYSSSDESAATVNASGRVHIVGAGTPTITATLSASGCYEEKSISYTINIYAPACEDPFPTITTTDRGCSGIQMSVSESGSYQWYKNDAEIDGETENTYTATEEGEYYVIVTNSCDRASNTVTIAAKESVTATKIVNSWYVKNGRRTPDIALVQTENATGFYVKIGDDKIWDEANSVTTGFGGCGFYLGEDGIIYLKGQKNDGTAPSGLDADKTLKITATGCGGNAGELSINIKWQDETDRPSVAFVSLGTEKGAFTDTTANYYKTTPLYKYLDYTLGGGAFDLTAQNIYSTVDEQALREHYSQFDAILITDDPNTGKKKDGKSYVDAMGALIDIRPMLTMEAFVSKLANWKAKGINGNPSSPNPRQYGMKLECKDHEIFADLNSASSNVDVKTIDGIDYWTVLMVDSTKSPYSGVAYNASTSDKPALQGFSASDVSGLLLLGEISAGTLYAGVERQDEPAARLMLLGLNNKALPNALTDEGKKVIANALTYLLKTNMEDVDDCSNYFTGAAGTTNWNTAENWSKSAVPNSPTTKVRILKPCVVSGGTFQVASVDIATSGKSGQGGGVANCTGSLTINADGALIVGGKVRTAVAPNFNSADLMPTTVNDLVINTNSTAQACLIMNNDAGDTKATVNLYSLGRNDGSYQFQYMAIPMSYVPVNPSFAGAGIYTYVWQESSNGWERRGYYTDLYAFEGVGITTTAATASNYQMKGSLAPTTTKEIALTRDNKGLNLVGNSWTAPIQISKLSEDNTDDNIEKVVYIYSTGYDAEDGALSGGTETAGQWLAIPFNAAGFEAWGGLKVIPSMQAFQVKVKEGGATLTLDYDKVVRGDNQALNAYLRAPKRTTEPSDIVLTRLRVADTKTHTDLYLFEGEQFSDTYDNGWEANFRAGDGRSAMLYARTAAGVMAVAALPELEGTQVFFIPGKETEYTFTFTGGDDTYYLNDIKEQKSTLINEANSYTFRYESGDAANRFIISRTPFEAPSVTTGITDLDAETPKAIKVIYNDKLYIIRGGRVYSADGSLVK